MRRIREMEKATDSSPVPALALSAVAQEKDRRRAGESGFQQYLTKPIEPIRLISALAALVSGR
jgi:CheY-like chemotaxis protein